MKLIGDPHLGKKFTNNVPLHRRGEREEMVRKQFREEVLGFDDLKICVGDLFDGAVVPFNDIMFAARTCRSLSEDHDLIVIAGNHDTSRDLDRVSAFDIFAAMMEDVENVHVLKEPTSLNGIAFFPWHPVISAEELVDSFQFNGETIAVGHWDVDERMDPFNLVPTKKLAAAGVKTVFTGHDHKARTLNRDGIEVVVVGSMQPFAHGEENDEALYVTRSLAEVLDDPKAYRDKCLRIRLESGEVLEEQIDCLQLVLQRSSGSEAEEDEFQVTTGDFDMAALFRSACDDAGLDDDTRVQLWRRYEEQLSK